jgi:hypothetical protein
MTRSKIKNICKNKVNSDKHPKHGQILKACNLWNRGSGSYQKVYYKAI